MIALAFVTVHFQYRKRHEKAIPGSAIAVRCYDQNADVIRVVEVAFPLTVLTKLSPVLVICSVSAHGLHVSLFWRR